jgi:ribosomal protein S27AE
MTERRLYRLTLVCPRCGFTAIHCSDRRRLDGVPENPRFGCGECMKQDLRTIEMKIVAMADC